MYNVSKPGANSLSVKFRGLAGINTKVSTDPSHKTISPPNERSFVDTVDQFPNGPNPVFSKFRNGSSSSRRKPRPDKTPEKEVCRVKPDAEVVSFFAVSWNSLQTTPEAEKKNCASKSSDIVYYRPQNAVKVPEFTPCNYEDVWADHHYRKLIRRIDLSIQDQRP